LRFCFWFWLIQNFFACVLSYFFGLGLEMDAGCVN